MKKYLIFGIFMSFWLTEIFSKKYRIWIFFSKMFILTHVFAHNFFSLNTTTKGDQSFYGRYRHKLFVFHSWEIFANVGQWFFLLLPSRFLRLMLTNDLFGQCWLDFVYWHQSWLETSVKYFQLTLARFFQLTSAKVIFSQYRLKLFFSRC